MDVEKYDGRALEVYAAALLEAAGVPGPDARVAAESLVRADLEGHEGHGVSRLPVYVRRLREGRVNPVARPVVDRRGAVLLVDGDNGLGQVVAVRALEAAYPVAEELGAAVVLIRRSNHFGTAAYLCQEAAARGYAAVVTTNSPPGIAPWGGREAFFGTNPIAFGFPGAGPEEAPLVADLSSSVVARGKIMMAAKRGERLPEGWALGPDGSPTTDPGTALQGSLLPLGGAKGYALALSVELLSGILTGAAYGPHIGNLYKDGDGEADVGHFILLLRLSHWLPEEVYAERMQAFVEEIKAVPPAPGAEAIRIPGEGRARAAERGREAGVPVPEPVRRELEELGRQLGVPFPGPVKKPGGKKDGEGEIGA